MLPVAAVVVFVVLVLEVVTARGVVQVQFWT